MNHPTCPKCNGLLKHEPADILGPERVKCILCGWEKIRSGARPARVAPVSETVKTSPVEPKPKLSPKPKADPRPTDGTCASCHRAGLVLNNGGICGRCTYRLSKGIEVMLPNQQSGIMAPRKGATSITPIQTKETTHMPSKRGTCPLCKRENVLMPGPKCSRCYSRAKLGLDLLTGEPLPVFRAHDHSDLSSVKDTVKPAAKSAAAALPASGFSLDVLAVIDEAWSSKRAAFIDQILAADKTADKLRITLNTLASVRDMSFEA